MNRWFQILFLILVFFATGCTGAGGPGGLGGIGGGAGPGGGSPEGGLTPPGLPPPGGTPPPGGGAGAPNQPNQEGIPRLRPNMVIVDVKPPVKSVVTARMNDSSDGGTLENAPPPEDPFPGDKPKVYLKTVQPNADYPFISTDSLGVTMVSYYPTTEKNGDTETCVTHVEIYATYQENSVNYRSDTYTSDACPGSLDQGPSPTINLQLVALPPSHVDVQGLSNPVYYAP
jgi:hypothetical protein